MSRPVLRAVSDGPQEKPKASGRITDASQVPTVGREEFLDSWEYSPGQHVTFLGPTQRGKTTFAIQLLNRTVSPELPCVIYAGKPPGRDATMAQAAKTLNLRVTEEWPPDWNYRDRKRNGYVLRPKHTMVDLDEDDENLKRQFRKGLKSNYSSRKPVITVLDERHHVENDLGLAKESNAALLRGAPINSQWNLLQRGRHVSYLVYDAPEHVFIFYDPDQSNRRRYSEIGGVDPKLVESICENLETSRTDTGMTISQCLYIRRSGPELAIVDVS